MTVHEESVLKGFPWSLLGLMSTSLKDRNLTLSISVRCRWWLTDYSFISISDSNFNVPHWDGTTQASKSQPMQGLSSNYTTWEHTLPPTRVMWVAVHFLGVCPWHPALNLSFHPALGTLHCRDRFPSPASVGRRVINCRCYNCPEAGVKPPSALSNKCHISLQRQHSGSTLSPH